MYNSIQDSLIIGKKVIYLPSCHSTNDIAAEIVHAGLFDEGTIVITDDQLSGRGQRGTVWTANPGENLTFSIILTPTFLPVEDQFVISQAVALGIRAYLAEYMPDVRIKWPNDIQVSGKKLCGILIENSIQGAQLKSTVVGIGVNINQLYTDNRYATSLATETNREYVLADEFQKLGRYLDHFYHRLKSEKLTNNLQQEYLDHLYGFNEAVPLMYKDKVYTGSVSDVSRQGLLSVRMSTGEEITGLGLKEIVWLKN
ncbi:biotin--[acetyl-CoA-carboxylase] ligase [Dyadobacter aurulentus]|uniref:biotin--[acetyl-CoA-carboxylase] ligase n=1 Tax=Dyadobacter sp. UC 10 TaxID=2605428 RepID=UPI0011F19A30|nr:biotin--[acetyl-CoA-carboxylase] ligase [Dyadobacter sp. UC 10]KAA0989414.1 biotin--[acetyl-CoA-carboxylase] ligase [Dyadobacter sp. UC 10]